MPRDGFPSYKMKSDPPGRLLMVTGSPPGRSILFFSVQRFSVLQVQDALPDLLGTALIPELGADVSAGAAGHVHLVLIPVAAVRADPDQLAVVLFNGNREFDS